MSLAEPFNDEGQTPLMAAKEAIHKGDKEGWSRSAEVREELSKETGAEGLV